MSDPIAKQRRSRAKDARQMPTSDGGVTGKPSLATKRVKAARLRSKPQHELWIMLFGHWRMFYRSHSMDVIERLADRERRIRPLSAIRIVSGTA